MLDQALGKVVIAGNKSFGGNGLTNNDHNGLKAVKGNVSGCMSESLTTFGIKKINPAGDNFRQHSISLNTKAWE